jgi:hypothetical protein
LGCLAFVTGERRGTAQHPEIAPSIRPAVLERDLVIALKRQIAPTAAFTLAACSCLRCLLLAVISGVAVASAEGLRLESVRLKFGIVFVAPSREAWLPAGDAGGRDSVALTFVSGAARLSADHAPTAYETRDRERHLRGIEVVAPTVA